MEGLSPTPNLHGLGRIRRNLAGKELEVFSNEREDLYLIDEDSDVEVDVTIQHASNIAMLENVHLHREDDSRRVQQGRNSKNDNSGEPTGSLNV